MQTQIRRVVLFTSSNVNEPRGVKHAVLIAGMYPEAEVEFIDMSPAGTELATPLRLSELPSVSRLTCYVPHRNANPLGVVLDRGLTRAARIAFSRIGRASRPAISTTARRLHAFVMRRPPADLYIGHNIDALPTLRDIAVERRVAVVFDSMEYYSDMGLSRLEGEIIAAVEQACLPQCSLVLTSSDDLSTALERRYRIGPCLALYNAPLSTPLAPVEKPDGMSLYWRNTVIGFGARGLEDALVAMTRVPRDVTLHLQGGQNASTDAVRAKVRSLGLEGRVTLYGPYVPHEAILAASRFHVGLCLERDVCENHRLTVSNKLFDYLMAGLAVIVSDLPGLRRVVERSGGGLLYRPGAVDELVEQIRRLYEDHELRHALAERSRAFALREGNEAHELAKLEARLRPLLDQPG